MAIGNQPTTQIVNTAVGRAAVSMRQVMESARDVFTQVNTLGAGGLEAIGFSSADAASIVTAVGYMNTIVGCYYGTVQQGGTGGTGATLYDFDNALSVTWGFQ